MRLAVLSLVFSALLSAAPGGAQQPQGVFPAASLRLKLYVWHVTNPATVVTGKQAPILEERGPFVWSRRVDRSLGCDNRTAADDEDSSCFYPREEFTFLANESCAGICQDVDGRQHTVLSVSFVGVVTNAKMLGVKGRVLMDLITSEWKARNLVFTQRSASELAFGWQDELLNSLRTFDGTVNTFIPGLTARSTANQSVADARAAGPSIVRTRVPVDAGNDVDAPFVGELLLWRGGTSSTCCTADRQACPPNAPSPPWSPPLASAVRGSADGLLFRPGLTPTSIVRAWSPEALRSVLLVANGTVPCGEASCMRMMFDPTRSGEESDGITPESYDLVSPPGLMTNFSRCNSGVPVLSTAPHFLFVESAAVKGTVQGVSPADLDAHGTYADVDPETGVTQWGAERAQLAVPLAPADVEGSTWLPHLPRVPLFPVLWFELSGGVLPINNSQPQPSPQPPSPQPDDDRDAGAGSSPAWLAPGAAGAGADAHGQRTGGRPHRRARRRCR